MRGGEKKEEEEERETQGAQRGCRLEDLEKDAFAHLCQPESGGGVQRRADATECGYRDADSRPTKMVKYPVLKFHPFLSPPFFFSLSLSLSYLTRLLRSAVRREERSGGAARRKCR